MIPVSGEGEFHEEVEVFGGSDSFHSEADQLKSTPPYEDKNVYPSISR